MSKPIRVGTYTLLEPTEFQTLYECASWYQRVRVPAGTYEVLAYPHSLAESDVGNMLYVQAEGQVTDDHEGRAPAGQTARASIHLNTYWPGGADAGPKGLVLDDRVVERRVWTTDEGGTMTRLVRR